MVTLFYVIFNKDILGQNKDYIENGIYKGEIIKKFWNFLITKIKLIIWKTMKITIKTSKMY